MTSSVQLGPLALPLGPLVFLGAAWAGLWMGARFAPEAERPAADRALFRVLLVGVVVARLSYVWLWRQAYAEQPWSILDIRDGGWAAGPGLAAACLYAVSLGRPRPVLRKPLLAGLGTALVLWGLGVVALWSPKGDQAPLPSLRLATLEGAPVDLRSFAGRPTVVNLWATWCPPCRREMPVLQEAQRAHPGVHIVFVNQGEQASDVRRFLQAHGLTLQNVLVDPAQRAGAAFGQQGLPTTLFYDAQGRLVSSRLGELSKAVLADRLTAIGATSPSPPP